MAQLAFEQAIDTPEGRWKALRNLLAVWGDVTLLSAPSSERRMAEAEEIAERPLPYSLIEAIKLSSELEAAGWAYDFKFDRTPEVEGLILGTYCDASWYVAIYDDDLAADDPPVHFFMREDYDSGPLRHANLLASYLTCHSLIGLLDPLSRAAKGGDFNVQVDLTVSWLDEMRACFVVSATFSEYHIFENPGQLIVVGPEYHLPDDDIVSMHGIWKSIQDDVPKCVRRHLNNGGAFSGRFDS